MAENTNIEWADFTFNPWWGCQRVSPGCENCYAETLDNRLRPEGGVHWGPLASRKMMSESYWQKPLRWNRAAERAGIRHRVFCASMADVFEDRPELETPRQRLWQLIRDTPHLDWMLLTKRPENFRKMLPWSNELYLEWKPSMRPWPNVWLGVTAENQAQADKRIPELLWINASVRFVSYEPALEEIDLNPPVCNRNCRWRYGAGWSLNEDSLPFCNKCGMECGFGAWLDPLNDGIDWVIAGAESGPGRRPMDEEWVRSVRDQCVNAGVAFFYKQKVDASGKVSLPALDGKQWAEFPEVALDVVEAAGRLP